MKFGSISLCYSVRLWHISFRVFCDITIELALRECSHILPHGSYLVNLAQGDPAKAAQAYDCFVDDLQRCESLEIKLYNFQYATLWSPPSYSARVPSAKIDL
jgi:AP endonuclease-1